MSAAGLPVLLLLAAGLHDSAKPATPTPSLATKEWRLPTGGTPSQAELAAIVAACRNRDGGGPEIAAIDPCLTGGFGMRRVP